MYIWVAVPKCRRLERQAVERAFSRACANTGNRIAARMAMMAITTSSSMRVKPERRFRSMNNLPPDTWQAGQTTGDDGSNIAQGGRLFLPPFIQLPAPTGQWPRAGPRPARHP